MPYGLRTTTGSRAIAPIWDRKRRNKVQLVSPLTRTKKRQTLPSRTTDRSAQMATSFSFSIRLANVWGRKEFWEAAESAAMLQPRIGSHRRPGRCGNKKTPNAAFAYPMASASFVARMVLAGPMRWPSSPETKRRYASMSASP